MIIEVALNGPTSKDENPNVPRTVDEIAGSALACIEAGASIVHNHNDEPNVGGTARHDSEPYIAAWRRILERHPDAILYPTYAGGGPYTNIKERNAHQEDLADAGVLGMALCDTGSVNFGGPHVYENTFDDVQHLMQFCRRRRLGPSISVFEPGFLRLALEYHRHGELPRGALIKLYFGGDRYPFGLPPSERSLEAYLAMLEGTGLPWLVAVLGGDVTADGFARMALERGGHVRVGLEDYAGGRRPRNEELVAEAARLAGEAGREVATPARARELLGLP